MAGQARIWNRFAKGYAKRAVADQASYEIKLKKTAAVLSPEAQVLEVGCGTGSTALWHAPSVAHVEATDFSDAMIAIAKDKAAAAGITNVTFRVAALEDPTHRETYDAVLAMSVLHLMPNPTEAIRHLAGLLKPGGLLITSTVCLRDMGRILPHLVPALGWTRIIPAVTSLSKTDLIAAHEAAGLTIFDEFQPGTGKAVFLIANAPTNASI